MEYNSPKPRKYEDMPGWTRGSNPGIKPVRIRERKLRKKKGEVTCTLVRNKMLFPHVRSFGGHADSRWDATIKAGQVVMIIAEEVKAHSYRIADEECEGKIKKAIRYNSRDKTYEAAVEYITKEEDKARLQMRKDEWKEFVESLEG